MDIPLEIRMFFLISKPISDRRQLTKEKSRVNNTRRRSHFGQQQQLQMPPQYPQYLHHHRPQELRTR